MVGGAKIPNNFIAAGHTFGDPNKNPQHQLGAMHLPEAGPLAAQQEWQGSGPTPNKPPGKPRGGAQLGSSSTTRYAGEPLERRAARQAQRPQQLSELQLCSQLPQQQFQVGKNISSPPRVKIIKAKTKSQCSHEWCPS